MIFGDFYFIDNYSDFYLVIELSKVIDRNSILLML